MHELTYDYDHEAMIYEPETPSLHTARVSPYDENEYLFFHDDFASLTDYDDSEGIMYEYDLDE